MKTLTATKLIGHGEDINGEDLTYCVYEFSNGLVIVPDYFDKICMFIEDRHAAELGNVTTTTQTKTWTAKELMNAWGNSFKYFELDAKDPCKDLIKKLVFN